MQPHGTANASASGAEGYANQLRTNFKLRSKLPLGAALFYLSAPLLLFVCGFLLVTHLFVILYEEPTLKRSFGPDYEAYRHSVLRWWPRLQR